MTVLSGGYDKYHTGTRFEVLTLHSGPGTCQVEDNVVKMNVEEARTWYRYIKVIQGGICTFLKKTV